MNLFAAHHRCSASVLLWSCIALFGTRVIGQFEVLMFSPPWLPEMSAWYSGLLPYPLLLPVQIVLLMVMSAVAWNRRVRAGCFARANPRITRALRAFALLYFAFMAARLAVQGADGAIPVAFHWVLALFVLVSARAAEASADTLLIAVDDEPYGDVSPIPQPIPQPMGQ